MGRLTKYFADGDEYGYELCHGGCESCDGVLCGNALEMIKKLAHYEDMEEMGYRMVNIDKVVEQLEEQKIPNWSASKTEKILRRRNFEDAIEIVKGGSE